MRNRETEKIYNESFAVFILSHERAEHLYTYKTLRERGYTGEIYIVIDSQDKQIERYKQNFSYVLIFNNKEINTRMDIGDNINVFYVGVFARNFIFEYAEHKI